jgi:hypothetical protein
VDKSFKNTQLQCTGKGIRVRVDIGTLIDRVYVNPLNPSLPEDLLALLESYKIAIDTSKLIYRWIMGRSRKLTSSPRLKTDV